jgi:hypothetical protein
MNDHVAPLIPLEFPDNPAVGDQYVAPNGFTYIWDGTVWTVPGSGSAPPADALVPIGQNPPANPQPGQLWWRNDPDATLYIFYFDGTTSQWVSATPGGSGGGAFLPLIGGTLTGPLTITETAGASSVITRDRLGTPELVFTTSGGAASNIIFNYGAPAWGISVEQNVFHIYHQTAPGNAVNPLTINNDNSITIIAPLTLADITGSTYLELVGSAQNNIAFRGSGPASGAPQWAIDVITGQSPAMNGFHLARLSSDGLTVIDDVFNILNSDGIIRAGTIRTKSGDPIDSNDLARKAYVDQRVLKTGDTMSGPLVLIDPAAISIDLNGIVSGIQFKNPNNAPQWIIDVDAGTGQNIAGFYLQRVSPDGNTVLDIPIQIYNSDGIIRANMIRTTAGDPVDPDDLARKAYVDSLLSPLMEKIAQLEATVNQLRGRRS